MDKFRMANSGIDIYRKSTCTGQYTRYDSFEPWSRKTALVRSLFHRAVNICSHLTFFNKQISIIFQSRSWNGFPANVRFSIIRKLKIKYYANSSKDSSNHCWRLPSFLFAQQIPNHSQNKGNICLIGQFLTLRNSSVAKQLAMEITRWPQPKENKLCVFFCISFKI